MGQHDCTFSHQGKNVFGTTSSGDVTLHFSGGSWRMPDMILHYVQDHGYQPPAKLINDVMNGVCIGGGRSQTRSASQPVSVGYLVSDDFPTGDVPEGFVEKLEALMLQYDHTGNVASLRIKSDKGPVYR